MAIMNSNGDSASPRKIPFWIFVSAKLFPPAVNFTLNVFMVFSIKFMTSCDILNILRLFIIQFCGTISFAFCSQSRSWPGFFAWSCFHMGCVDICRVTLLCLWILCGILSVLQGRNRCLLASSRSLPLFVLLIFSTSSISKLLVYNYLKQFFCLGQFGCMLSFLWSSSQVLVHLVSICLFLVLVRGEWRWISWTRIHVFNLGMVFCSLVSFVSFWVFRCLYPLSNLLRVLLVLSSYYLSIQLFSYALLVGIIMSKNIRFLWRPFVGMFLCHAFQFLVAFSFVVLECPFLFVLFYPFFVIS